MLMGLVYVPVDEVVDAFEYFERNSKTLNRAEQEKDRNVYDFMKYFVDHYIGRPKRNGQRGKPQFPLNLWNVNENTSQGVLNRVFTDENIIFSLLFYLGEWILKLNKMFNSFLHIYLLNRFAAHQQYFGGVRTMPFEVWSIVII